MPCPFLFPSAFFPLVPGWSLPLMNQTCVARRQGCLGAGLWWTVTVYPRQAHQHVGMDRKMNTSTCTSKFDLRAATPRMMLMPLGVGLTLPRFSSTSLTNRVIPLFFLSFPHPFFASFTQPTISQPPFETEHAESFSLLKGKIFFCLATVACCKLKHLETVRNSHIFAKIRLHGVRIIFTQFCHCQINLHRRVWFQTSEMTYRHLMWRNQRATISAQQWSTSPRWKVEHVWYLFTSWQLGIFFDKLDVDQ